MGCLFSGVASNLSAAARFQALRQRMGARQQQAHHAAVMQAKITSVEESIVTCEDAIMLHAVVEQLFARFSQGHKAAASEIEVIHAISSSSFATQCRRPLSAEATRAALSSLSTSAAGWFRVEPAQYSDTSILTRNPGGSPAQAMIALKACLMSLRSELGYVNEQKNA